MIQYVPAASGVGVTGISMRPTATGVGAVAATSAPGPPPASAYRPRTTCTPSDFAITARCVRVASSATSSGLPSRKPADWRAGSGNSTSLPTVNPAGTVVVVVDVVTVTVVDVDVVELVVVVLVGAAGPRRLASEQSRSADAAARRPMKKPAWSWTTALPLKSAQLRSVPVVTRMPTAPTGPVSASPVLRATTSSPRDFFKRNVRTGEDPLGASQFVKR